MTIAPERVINLVPEMFDKVTSVVNKAKKEKEKAASNDAAEYVSAVPQRMFLPRTNKRFSNFIIINLPPAYFKNMAGG